MQLSNKSVYLRLKVNCNEILFFSFCAFLHPIGPLVKVEKITALSQVSMELGAAKVAHYSIVPVMGGVY